jgi:phosphohistidine phosphatase
MQIYILRHGIAEDAPPGQSDSARRLTSAGKQKLRRILTVARDAGVHPGVLLSSPYKRAMETAEIAHQILGLTERIIQTDVLTPAYTPERVWDEIRLHRDAEQIMLAGHEPQLSSLLQFLTGGRVEMKKGALARVDTESLSSRPNGTLIWLLTAKLAGA